MDIAKKQMAVVIHENLRSEQHGDQPTAALDITLKLPVTSDVLAYLVDGSGIKTHLYDEKGEPRFPLLNPVRLARKIESVRLTVYDKLDEKDRMVFSDCTMKDIALDLTKGHLANMTCKVQILPQSNKGQGDRLFSILKKSVEVDLVICQEDFLAKNDGPATPPKKAPPKKAPTKKKSKTKR